MQVKVKLFATLCRYAPHEVGAKPFWVNIHPGSTLKTIVDDLDIPEAAIKISFINGRARKLDYPLKPGDDVGLFPPIGGG